MTKDLLTSTFERLRSRLLTKASAILANDDEARDVLQDVFFKLWQSTDIIDRESQATGLLTTAVRNLSIDRLRRRHAKAETPLIENFDRPDIEADAEKERTELLSRVEAIAAKHLSPRDREILYRRDRDEWSFEEIAEHFNVTAPNARLIVARARKTIRTLYNLYNDD